MSAHSLAGPCDECEGECLASGSLERLARDVFSRQLRSFLTHGRAHVYVALQSSPTDAAAILLADQLAAIARADAEVTEARAAIAKATR